MKAALYQYNDSRFIKNPKSDDLDTSEAQLVLCFGAKKNMQAVDFFSNLKQEFPAANIAMCSTAGEICGTEVADDTVSITAFHFADTRLVTSVVNIDEFAGSYEAGASLVNKFSADGLAYLLVLSDGGKVNGSELVRGLNSVVSSELLITGGLAGDGANFQSTLVGLNDTPAEGVIAGIAFYGDKIKVNHGSQGGWETFGLEKMVTRSNANVVYEISGQKALDIYKKYLGHEAEFLPASALLFPLSVSLPGPGENVVRTILSINEEVGSMTFAGDVPEGALVRFMKANFDKITHAASDAALQTLDTNEGFPRYALLISCVGRKLILQSRIEEEIEAVNEMFNGETLLGGFYSYGEISPLLQGGDCQLHNQTMTITTFNEIE